MNWIILVIGFLSIMVAGLGLLVISLYEEVSDLKMQRDRYAELYEEESNRNFEKFFGDDYSS